MLEYAEGYPGIEDEQTGGYIFPTSMNPRESLPGRLLHIGGGTPVRENEWVHRPFDYLKEHFMLEEVMFNAVMRGNQNDSSKKVWFLWHRCHFGRELYVIDEGETTFSWRDELEGRNAMNIANRRFEEGSGLNTLNEYAHEFTFYAFMDGNQKKGTLLKILLDKPFHSPAKHLDTTPCPYFGHSVQLYDREMKPIEPMTNLTV